METKIDFSTFLLSITSAAMMNLGICDDGSTDSSRVNLGLAKQNIELLELLKEKTKNNLTQDELQLMENLLFQVRMHFVEVTKK